MGRIIELTVENEYVQGAGVVIGAAGSHHDVTLRITFGSMWDGLYKYAVFRDARGENPSFVLITEDNKVDDNVYDISVPYGAKSVHGNMMLTLYGYTLSVDENEVGETQATTTTTAYFRVLPSDFALLEDGSVDENLAEQLQAAIVTHQSANPIAHPDGSVTETKLETSLKSKINESYNVGVSNTARIAAVESGKADKSDTYTKSETYTKTEANTLLGGKADLENGKVPASQLPSFVDDVLEGTYVDATEFDDKNGDPYTPEGGKLYVDVSPNSPYFNRTYRWSGSQYSEVSESLALGETSSTAYAGDKGKQNADDIASLKTRMTTAEGDVSDIKDNVSELQDDVYGEETPTTQSYEFTVNQTLDNKGEIVQVPGNHTTEEIAIPPTATGMTYSGTIYYNRAGVIFYDENGGWVSSDAIGTNPPATYTNKSITIPAGAKTVVAQCRNQELESAQFSITFGVRSAGLQDDISDLKSGKADKDTTYTKTQVDTALGQKAEQSGLQAEITNRTNADMAINHRIDTVEKIAKGANQAVSFASYSTLVTSLNTEADTKYRAGQNLMVITLDVPDLWVSGVSQTSVPYTYVDDETFLEDMADSTLYGGAGKIQVGYYILSQLETQKVDLTDYMSELEHDAWFNVVGGGCKIDTTTTWSSGFGNALTVNANHMHRVINPIVADEDAYFVTRGFPARSDVTAEYLLDFTTGATAPTVSFSSDVTFVPALEIKANKRYQISIMDGIGLWVESEAPAVTEND